MSQFCFICSKRLTESETVIDDYEITTLIDSSVVRIDRVFEYLKDQKSKRMHVKPRKMFTQKITIAADEVSQYI